MGHPVLRVVAEAVADPTAPEIAALVDDMLATLDDIGGLGLAAPQVHLPRRVVIFHLPAARLDTEDEGERPIDMTVLVNPVIEPLGTELEYGWEGCLSVPGLRGLVARHSQIRYSGLTLDGTVVEREADGLHARILQHEIDHLDGVLYPERMTDLKWLVFETEMRHAPDRTELEEVVA